jgi:hypothetical protein
MILANECFDYIAALQPPVAFRILATIHRKIQAKVRAMASGQAEDRPQEENEKALFANYVFSLIQKDKARLAFCGRLVHPSHLPESNRETLLGWHDRDLKKLHFTPSAFKAVFKWALVSETSGKTVFGSM